MLIQCFLDILGQALKIAIDSFKFAFIAFVLDCFFVDLAFSFTTIGVRLTESLGAVDSPAKAEEILVKAEAAFRCRPSPRMCM